MLINLITNTDYVAMRLQSEPIAIQAKRTKWAAHAFSACSKVKKFLVTACLIKGRMSYLC